MTNIYCTNPKKDRKMKSHGSAVSKKTFVAFWINNLHDDKKKPTHLHWSIEIDQICQAKALQPNAKCPALGSSCLAEGLAQGCRAENGGKFLLFGDAKWLVATRFYGEWFWIQKGFQMSGSPSPDFFSGMSENTHIIDISIYIIDISTINIRILGVITQLILSLPRHVGPPWAPWHRAASSSRC